MSKAISAPRGEREDPEGSSGADVVQLALGGERKIHKSMEPSLQSRSVSEQRKDEKECET